MTFDKLEENAAADNECEQFIDIDSPDFRLPGDMPEKIKAFLARTGQKPLDDIAAISRCVFNSLAMEYKLSYNQLTEITGKNYKKLYIMGGGSKSKLLNGLSASALDMEVQACAEEASALGNIMMQCGRRTVAGEGTVFKPQNAGYFDRHYLKYLIVKEKGKLC